MHNYYVPVNEKNKGDTTKSLYYIHKDHKAVRVYGGGVDNAESAECQIPAMLSVKTKDCWDCNLQKFLNDEENKDEIDALLDKPMNPCTGPICFKGVKAGEVLKITIEDIECGTGCLCEKCQETQAQFDTEDKTGQHRIGSVMTIDFEGVCRHIVKERVTKIYEFDENHVMRLGDCDIQLHPMIGVIGVLPDTHEEIQTCSPGNWGGNLDTTLLKKGSTLYLPVQLDGGMLYMGDAHAQMGEGEQYTTGLETSATYKLKVDVEKKLDINTPFAIADGRLVCIYTHSVSESYKLSGKAGEDVTDTRTRGTDAALIGAMDKLIRFISRHAKKGERDYNEVGIVCGLFADLAISQIADDPYRTARCSIELSLLKDYYGIEFN